MDFSLLEKHPWATTGIVVGGGVLLFVVMRRGGGGSAQPASTGYVGVDPAAAQAQAQATASATQAQTYIAGLQLQGATQISLAQIGADVSKLNISASADATNRQTDAQVALGLGTQSAVVEQSRINAALQNHYIDAIVAAFRGGTAPGATPYPQITPTPGSMNPTVQTPPMVTYPYPVSGGTGGGVPIGTGGTNPGTIAPGMAPLPGGTELVARPNYANCDPRDVACVMRNQDLSIGWVENTAHAQTTNNFNQCMQNANQSADFKNYDSLVAACHSSYGL